MRTLASGLASFTLAAALASPSHAALPYMLVGCTSDGYPVGVAIGVNLDYDRIDDLKTFYETLEVNVQDVLVADWASAIRQISITSILDETVKPLQPFNAVISKFEQQLGQGAYVEYRSEAFPMKDTMLCHSKPLQNALD